MTLEENVYNFLLDNHMGIDNLIKNKDLRLIFNIGSDKSMRKVIQNIREDKNYPEVIGSLSGKSGGFYVCNTDQEIDSTIDNIKHRANQMWRMVYVLEWKRNLRGSRLCQ